MTGARDYWTKLWDVQTGEVVSQMSVDRNMPTEMDALSAFTCKFVENRCVDE